MKWKIVPVEPTEEMLDCCYDPNIGTARHKWDAMIAAAPAPDDAMVERVARAICISDLVDPDKPEYPEQWGEYLKNAAAAIAATEGSDE